MKTPLIDLSRTIAFQRSFVTITGSINAALMLSQAVYWTPRAGKDGWFYKSTKEWEAESGLSMEQQRLARKKLTASRFFEEKREEGSAVFFRVNMEVIETALREAMTPTGKQTPRETLVPPLGKPDGTPRETLIDIKEQRLPETTTETPISEQPALQLTSDEPIPSEYTETANTILADIRVINSKHKQPNLAQWANTIRLMQTRDNRTTAEILELWKWANTHRFWSSNILSPDKLRAQWDRLVIQRGNEAKPTKPSQPYDGNRDAVPPQWRHEWDAYMAEGGWTGWEAMNQILTFDHPTRRFC